MPKNGYWIECIPIGANTAESPAGLNTDKDFIYHATIPSFPEAKASASSPDKAIQALRDKLATLRHEYCTQGRSLPEHDNPVSPPRNFKSTQGWISVYVKMSECCKNLN
jgi:predicted RNase H-like HicB family nuclease